MEDMDEALEHAMELARLTEKIDQMLAGVDEGDKISVLSSLLMRTVVGRHKTSYGVIAEMALILTTMIGAYKAVNEYVNEDEDEDEDEDDDMDSEEQTRQ